MEITTNEFSRFQGFLKACSGISLGENKQYLVVNRIKPVMRDNNIPQFSGLLSQLETSPGSSLSLQVIDAMTTNETFWFRDLSHFNYLEKKLLADVSKTCKGAGPRIWSAACSSGQEPYSISLIVEKVKKLSGLSKDFKIVATDISPKMVGAVNKGVYLESELSRGLSPEFKNDNFTNSRDGWQISESHRMRVEARKLNLLDDLIGIGKFDIIFCRNVLIYFAGPTKADILNKIKNTLNPNGYLFLSSSEILPAEITGFETVREMGCKCYRLK